ncbi:hypothetical protein TeGR_g6592 [Tetraparma gracilis]|uniref:DUF202 domain-containing protein n=1 Tax=Tetraparma gracilis TaxID=2962635 RepID=A0ABQ6N869_9STRA|nr:hypothetical protein TeGR_g6592 [Tetraparma gracilis]
MPQSESSPLLSSSAPKKSFYFAPPPRNPSQTGDSLTNPLPASTTPGNFAARPVGARHRESSFSKSAASPAPARFLGGIFGSKKQPKAKDAMLPRKAPVKIEPKVFFANERTFLAWLHTSVTLASIAIAIIAFSASSSSTASSRIGQWYGLTLLPVSVAFMVYALRQYTSRAGMIRRREPGPYEDTVGPVFLGVALCVSIVANFGLKLWEMTQ